MTTLTIGKDPVQITLSGHTMGSDYAVKYINWADGTPQPAPETLKAAIDDRLQQVNDEMSTYIPSSHISRINQLRDTESYTPPAARLRPCFSGCPTHQPHHARRAGRYPRRSGERMGLRARTSRRITRRRRNRPPRRLRGHG